MLYRRILRQQASKLERYVFQPLMFYPVFQPLMFYPVFQCRQTRKHFCEKHCFLPMFCHVFQCGQTRKHFCRKHCFVPMFCHVFQCGQTRKHFCEKHCFLLMFCHVSQCGLGRIVCNQCFLAAQGVILLYSGHETRKIFSFSKS